MTHLCFLDTETTGLDPDRHEVYEIGLIDDEGRELHLWVSDAPVATADPTALRIGRYYERWPHRQQMQQLQSLPVDFGDPFDPWAADLPKPYILPGKTVSWVIARATANAHLVGAVPSFDATFLDRLLRRHGLVPAWHYHLVDVEALAAGYLAHMATTGKAVFPELPWDSEALSVRVGVQPSRFDRHTALGDARWARAIYDAVVGGDPS